MAPIRFLHNFHKSKVLLTDVFNQSTRKPSHVSTLACAIRASEEELFALRKKYLLFSSVLYVKQLADRLRCSLLLHVSQI